jgi:hypothetical protein
MAVRKMDLLPSTDVMILLNRASEMKLFWIVSDDMLVPKWHASCVCVCVCVCVKERV